MSNPLWPRFGPAVAGLTLLLLVCPRPAHAGERALSAAEFDRHVRYLADDQREGRGVGTRGIDEAADYIAARFEEAGLSPGGDTGSFFQSFEVSTSSRVAAATRLAIAARGFEARRRLALEKEFVPFPFSARGGFDGPVVFVGYGIEDDERGYNDYAGIDVAGKVALMLRFEPAWWGEEKVDEQAAQLPARTQTRHAYFATKAEHARRHGAKAILIVNPVPAEGNGDDDALYDFASGRASAFGLPMMHITRRAADALLKVGGLPDVAELQAAIDESRKPVSAPLDGVRANGYVSIARVMTPVRNVIGVVPGRGPHADEVVVIGAHYDHLGVTTNWKTPRDRTKYVHNGADDNASGTTALLLLARELAGGPPLERTVVLMAFTAEESGLLGSRHWVRNPTVPLKNVVAMINMDMIGRLKDDVLHVGGVGTGEGFRDLVLRLAEPYGLQVRDSGGGRGPSDHSSFYGENIPVLFFFTGLHRQYHQPDDDADLLNVEGACRITALVRDCAVHFANAPERPVFTRDASRFRPPLQDDPQQVARAGRQPAPAAGSIDHGAGGDDETPSMPRVRLGIAPGNYGEAEGRGFPIEYVTEGGPAERAGIRDKDRILSIDGNEITDVYSYMHALGRYKPGDEIEVVVLRGESEMKFKVHLDAAACGPARE